jgi:hypothetical protein
MPVCPNCGAQQPEGAVFCDECGRSIEASRPARTAPAAGPPVSGPPAPDPIPNEGRTVVASGICPSCGVQVAALDAFCGNCGAPIGAARAASPPSARGVVQQGGPPEPDPVPRGAVSVPAGASWQAPTLPKQRCTHCGAELAPESTFCDSCGASVTAASEADAAGLVPPSNVPARPPAASVTPGPDAPTLGASAPAWQPSQLPEAPAGSELTAAAPSTSSEDVAKHASSPQFDPKLSARGVLARILHPVSGVGLALPIGKAKATLGRDDPVRGIYPDLDLTDYGGPVGGVSRLHARITIVESAGEGDHQFYIEDLNSVNGTFVNEVKLTPNVRRQLNDGDELRLGRVKVVFRIAEPEVDR